jgi:hypothetical protein
MMSHGVSRSEAQPANQHQPKEKAEQRTRAECQLGIALRPLRLRFIFVEVSAHAPPKRQLSAISRQPSTFSCQPHRRQLPDAKADR